MLTTFGSPERSKRSEFKQNRRAVCACAAPCELPHRIESVSTRTGCAMRPCLRPIVELFRLEQVSLYPDDPPRTQFTRVVGLRKEMRRPAVSEQNRALQKQARSAHIAQGQQPLRSLEKALHVQGRNADWLGKSRRLAVFRELLRGG